MEDKLDRLAQKIKKLKEDPSVAELVRKRIEEFRSKRRSGCQEIFSELSFCILTANYSAEGGLRIQESIGPQGFLFLSEEQLARKLRELGHRYPRARAKYIVEARMKLRELCMRIEKTSEDEAEKLREWLVHNIKGLGYKEASHLLRNLGYLSLSIIDYHILDLLEKEGIINRPLTMTPRRYLEIEKILRNIAAKAGLEPGELDLYLWFMETGKILK